jgi:glycosyltransferase involved in cell wall biosynthesis
MLVTFTGTLKELSIDIVHTHLTRSTLLGILATRRMERTQLCATVHNVIFHQTRGRMSPRERLMRIAIRTAFPRADRIIAVSEEVAHAVQFYTGIPPERITTIPNGIDPERFRLEESRGELRQKLGFPLDRSVVVSIGRLTHQKGYPHLLDALALIPPAERPLALIVGDGPERHALKAKAAAMQLTHDVCFLGIRHDVPALLAAADAFILASLWEGLPLVLLEAMATGLPSVVTPVGENPKVIESGKSGLVVPVADAHALAEALCRLLREPMLRERMGQAARQRFERHFSLRKFVEAHEFLYEEMLTARPK